MENLRKSHTSQMDVIKNENLSLRNLIEAKQREADDWRNSYNQLLVAFNEIKANETRLISEVEAWKLRSFDIEKQRAIDHDVKEEMTKS